MRSRTKVLNSRPRAGIANQAAVCLVSTVALCSGWIAGGSPASASSSSSPSLNWKTLGTIVISQHEVSIAGCQKRLSGTTSAIFALASMSKSVSPAHFSSGYTWEMNDFVGTQPVWQTLETSNWWQGQVSEFPLANAQGIREPGTTTIDIRQTNILRFTSPSSSSILNANANLLPNCVGQSSFTQVFTPASWSSTLSHTVNADVAQSATLPDGRVVWVFGDTTQIDGRSVTSPKTGYPHDSLLVQSQNGLEFQVVPGAYEDGVQQVPNLSSNTYFWMSTPVVEKNTLYIFGETVQNVSPFDVTGTAIAEFNATTLRYEGLVTGGSDRSTLWSGVIPTANGWWLVGTHRIACTYVHFPNNVELPTKCNVGDTAYVPYGQLGNPSAWQIHENVIPSSNDLDSSIAVIKNGSGWDIFSKRGGEYGGNAIERLYGTSLSSSTSWQLTGLWKTANPAGTVTYGVAVHPEQTVDPNYVLVSYDVNSTTQFTNSNYFPRFMYLSLS